MNTVSISKKDLAKEQIRLPEIQLVFFISLNVEFIWKYGYVWGYEEDEIEENKINPEGIQWQAVNEQQEN